ncbi:MAG: arylsulfatase [Sphingomonas sp.]
MRGNRRDILKYGAMVAAGLQATPGFASSAMLPGGGGKRPNIILILADDMGYSDIGCYGSEIPTPNLDRLAGSGMRFAQFYNSPRCCPSRASLMTGLYSHQAHMGMMVVDAGRYPFPAYDGDLYKGAVTIAEALKSGGYSTFMAGKWHLTPHADTTDPKVDKSNWACQRGFDHFYGIITGAADYYNPNTLCRDNTPIRENAPDFYFTDGIADNAVKFIEQAPKDKPFFGYVAFNAPHWPLHAPEKVVAKHRERYKQGWDKTRADRHARQIAAGLLDAKWPLTKRDPRVPAWERASFKEWEAERMAVYAAQVDILDQGIGRIVAELEKQGELDNTLIFFMADNGGNFEEMGAHAPGAKRPIYMNYKTRDGRPIETGNSPRIMPGPETTYASYGGPWGNVSNTPFRLYKHFAHEGGISTPFIAHWPAGIAAKGAVTQQIGHEIDVMATCLAASGVSYPHDSVAGSVPPPLEGRSLLPAFAGKPVPNRGMIFWEHEGNCAVRDGKWKLVSRFPDSWELYDMEADRTESDDLVDREPEQVTRLAAAYEAWARRVGAQPWPMPQTPPGARTGELPMPDYLRVDRPIGSVVRGES